MKALPLAIAILAVVGNVEASNGGICQSCILRQQSHKDDLSKVKYYEDTEYSSKITKYTFDDEKDADQDNNSDKGNLADNTTLPPPAPRNTTLPPRTTTTTTSQSSPPIKQQLEESVHNKYGTNKSKTSNRATNTAPTTGTSSSSTTRNWGSVTGNPR